MGQAVGAGTLTQASSAPSHPVPSEPSLVPSAPPPNPSPRILLPRLLRGQAPTRLRPPRGEWAWPQAEGVSVRGLQKNRTRGTCICV